MKELGVTHPHPVRKKFFSFKSSLYIDLSEATCAPRYISYDSSLGFGRSSSRRSSSGISSVAYKSIDSFDPLLQLHKPN